MKHLLERLHKLREEAESMSEPNTYFPWRSGVLCGIDQSIAAVEEYLIEVEECLKEMGVQL